MSNQIDIVFFYKCLVKILNVNTFSETTNDWLFR